MSSHCPARVALLAVAGLACATSAQSVTLEFRADRTQAAPGDVVRWVVIASHTGYTDPTAWFGGFVGDFTASDLGFGNAVNLQSHLGGDAGTTSVDGTSILDVNIFQSTLFQIPDLANPIWIYGFDIEDLPWSGSLSYDAAGVCSVFPNDNIFTLPDEYDAFEVVSDTVTIDTGGLSEPNVTIELRADRERVYTGDTVTWTASIGFDTWGGPLAFVDTFLGDLTAGDTTTGVVADPVSLLGGELEAGVWSTDLTNIVVGQPEGGPYDTANPIDVLTFDVVGNRAGPLTYSASGETWLAPDQISRSYLVRTFEFFSDSVEVESNWPGPAQTAKLLPAQVEEEDHFGWAVAADDGVAIVGAIWDEGEDELSGAAYLFDTASGSLLARLTADDGAYNDDFGESVDISGGIAIVGAHYDDDFGFNSGAAYLFDVATGMQIRKLLPDSGDAMDGFGDSVALEGDYAVVAAPGDDDSGEDSGAVYVFDARTGEQLRKFSPGGPDDQVGRSIATSGSLLAVNASVCCSNVGVSIFDLDTGELVRTIRRPIGENVSGFGSPFAIDGDTLVVEGRNRDLGLAIIYVYDARGGEPLSQIVLWDRSATVRTLAISGDTVLVGNTWDSVNGVSAGAAYLIDIECGVQIGTLLPVDGDEGDYFGNQVALVGNNAVVGASRDDERGEFAGSAYIFDVSYPCTRVDIAAPWGLLDLADIVAFVEGYLDQRVAADVAEPFDVWDMDDLAGFVGAFADGCP